MFWGMGEGLFFIFQPLYIQELGADPVLIGTILGITAAIMTLAQIPFGYLSDRYGRRNILWMSWSLGVGATLIMALANTLEVFVVGLIFYALTAAVLAPMNSYIASARGDWSVGKALTFISAAYSVGAAFAPMAGGLIAERYGLRSIYLISATIFAVSSTLVFFIRKQPVETPEPSIRKFDILRNPRFVLSLAMIGMITFATYLPQPLTSNFLQNERGLSLAAIGQLGTVMNISNVIFLLLLGHIPVIVAFVIGEVAMIGFTLLLWLGGGLPWYLLAYMLMGGYRLIRSIASAFVRPIVKASQIGLAFGFVETAGTLAIIVAPILAGFLYDRAPESVLSVSLVILIISLALTLLVLIFRDALKSRLMGVASDKTLGN
jgi:MFS family permease